MVAIIISKAGESKAVEVDFEGLPKASQDYIVAYGLKQALNDCHASEKAFDTSLALAMKRLDALKAGNPPTSRMGSGKDAMTRELESIAAAQLRSVGIKAGEARAAVDTHGWELVVTNLARHAGKSVDDALETAMVAAQAKIDASKSAPTAAAITLAGLFAPTAE